MKKTRARNQYWAFGGTLGVLLLALPSACSSGSDNSGGAGGTAGALGASGSGGKGSSAAGEGGRSGEAGVGADGDRAAGAGGEEAGGEEAGGEEAGGEEAGGEGGMAGTGGTSGAGGAKSVGETGGSGGQPSLGGGLIQLFGGSAGMTLARDASGGLHVAASAQVNGTYSVVYAHCSSSCAQPNSWKVVPLPLESTTSEIPTIGVTGAGLPRIYAASDYGSTQGYHYLSCEAGCEQTTGWQDLRVSTRFPLPDPAPRPSLPFAVSAAGAAVFVSSDNSTMTASYCASSCANAASWSTVTLGGTYTYPESVLFGSDESIQLAGRHQLQNNESLLWITCKSDCQDGASWKGFDGLLTVPGQIDAALARTSQGGIRIAAYFDDPSTAAIDHVFALVNCDADCLTYANWYVLFPLPITPQSAGVGFALGLDASERPVIAYLNDTASGYTKCSGDCASPAGVWQSVAGLSVSGLNQAAPPTVPASCVSASWSMYTGPAFVLDGQGHPFIGVTARAVALGGQCGTGSSATTTGSFLVVPP